MFEFLTNARAKTHYALFAFGGASAVATCYFSKFAAEAPVGELPGGNAFKTRMMKIANRCDSDIWTTAVWGGMSACLAFYLLFQSPLRGTFVNSTVNFA